MARTGTPCHKLPSTTRTKRLAQRQPQDQQSRTGRACIRLSAYKPPVLYGPDSLARRRHSPTTELLPSHYPLSPGFERHVQCPRYGGALNQP